MRANEIQAQDKLREMQHETDQRKLKFEIEKLKEQIKDLKNNEEQLKSDHSQHVLELTDKIEEVRMRQAAEDEEQYLR